MEITKAPAMDKWIIKLWYTMTMEYHSAIKRNIVLNCQLLPQTNWATSARMILIYDKTMVIKAVWFTDIWQNKYIYSNQPDLNTNHPPSPAWPLISPPPWSGAGPAIHPSAAPLYCQPGPMGPHPGRPARPHLCTTSCTEPLVNK